MNEIYVSTDVEADGPIPGVYSMLSLGSAAFLADGTLVATFAANLKVLPGALQDPDTMRWWEKQPEAWKAARANLEEPEKVMKDYLEWVKVLPGKPVFVGYPTGFDFMFVYWYLIKFTRESPFSFSALDIKSYAMGVLGLEYRKSIKKNMPKRWFPETKHTHVAVQDAIEQGQLFINMLKENRIIRKPAYFGAFEERLADLEALEEGWHGEENEPGQKISSESLKLARTLVDLVAHFGLPAPYLYPTISGGISAEWDSSLQIDLTISNGASKVQLLSDTFGDQEFPIEQLPEWIKKIQQGFITGLHVK